MKYLGHAVDQERIVADPDKTAAIQVMRLPTNLSELRRFMGMVISLENSLKILPKSLKHLGSY